MFIANLIQAEAVPQANGTSAPAVSKPTAVKTEASNTGVPQPSSQPSNIPSANGAAPSAPASGIPVVSSNLELFVPCD